MIVFYVICLNYGINFCYASTKINYRLEVKIKISNIKKSLIEYTRMETILLGSHFLILKIIIINNDIIADYLIITAICWKLARLNVNFIS